MVRRKTILVAHKWPTNGDLIADVARLYLPAGATVLDPTWGRGRWWTRVTPSVLIRHDLYTLDGVDFRALPEPDEFVDVVVFDPPYVAIGGRETSGLKDFNNRYGLDAAPETVKGLYEMNAAGMAECARVLRPKGFLWVKTMNYVSSGHQQRSVFRTEDDAKKLGLRVVDEFIHIGDPRAQPRMRNGKPSVQKHARQNVSHLLIFQKRKV